MKLILALIDATESRHKGTDFLFPFLNALWQKPSDGGDFRFRKIREYLRIDKQYSFDGLSHIGVFRQNLYKDNKNF